VSSELVPVKWTRFMDMHSGGRLKTEWSKIYIEAPEKEAVVIFANRFANPYNVACSCCGSNYSISEYDSLQEASSYDREAQWDPASRTHLEERDRGQDKYILDIVRRSLKQFDKRTQDLYRMATSKGASEGERRNAMDMLAKTDKYPGLWHPTDFVPFEEFERTGRISKSRNWDATTALIIRSGDIKPEERIGEVRDPYEFDWSMEEADDE